MYMDACGPFDNHDFGAVYLSMLNTSYLKAIRMNCTGPQTIQFGDQHVMLTDFLQLQPIYPGSSILISGNGCSWRS